MFSGNVNAEKNKHYCYILPWLNLKDDIKIGDVTFKLADPKNLDDGSNTKLLESLYKSFKHFVKWNGKFTDKAAVCFYQNKWIFDQDFQYKQDIREAVDILSFLVTSRLNVLCFNGNEYMGKPPSAEVFKLATVPLQIESDKKYDVFSKAGVLVISLENDNYYFDLEPFNHGYQKLTTKQYDAKILELFNHLISLPRNEEIERILRSIIWFRYSQTESEEVDPFSCILMKMTAFEILLNLPDRDARYAFMEKIDSEYIEIIKNESSLFEFVKEDREIQRWENRVTVNKTECHNKLVWWAYDFYKLRSRIIHGDHLESKDMKRDDQKYNELIIADIVFSWLVSEKLQQLTQKNDPLIMYIFYNAFEKAGWMKEEMKVKEFESYSD